MGKTEMAEVAKLFARALIDNEDLNRVKQDVMTLKSNFQTIRYCFNEDEQSGYIL